MKVTAVLPAFNAEKTVRKTYEAIPKETVSEVILVDDASTDKTVARAEEIDDLIVIVHDQNKGYGGNQKTCYSEAVQRGADIIVMIHPDFQYDPTYLPRLVQPLQEGRADMVMGSRFISQDPRQHGMLWWRYFGNRFLTTMQNAALGTNLSEGHSGYRAYTKQLLQTVPYQNFSDSFVFDSQMLAAVATLGLRIVEVPIPTRYTSDSSSLSFSGSIRYGFATLRTLLPKQRKHAASALPNTENPNSQPS